MSDPRGYIRARGDKLEAVLHVPGEAKPVRRSTGLALDQRAEAEAVLAEALRQLRERALPSADVLTVQAWGETWIDGRKERGKLEYVHERTHLEHFLYPVLGRRPLAEITDVVLLDWARELVRHKGPSGRHPSPKYVRKITATVRALFKEAVRRHLIERSPCAWEDSDLPELEANARVTEGGYEAADVAKLIHDPRVPEDRRVLYALEFLTGLRTGEAAARRWSDWEPEFLGRLGRLKAATAYNTRHRITKSTKTRVEKWIPVHPALAELLKAWKAEGWQRFMGRAPADEDLIVPATRGGPRNNSHSWRCFQHDVAALDLPKQRHYETRATFISLAEGGGADPDSIARITHASLNGAKDLYRRVRLYWPRMCEAVMCIRLPAAREGEAQPAAGELAIAAGDDEPHEARPSVTAPPRRTGETTPEPQSTPARARAFDSRALPFRAACGDTTHGGGTSAESPVSPADLHRPVWLGDKDRGVR